MLETSKDFLYLAGGAALIALAAFICWAIFYFAMILRQGLQIFKEMRQRLNKIDELVKTLKEKIEHSTSYLLLIGEGVKKLVEVIREQTGGKKDEEGKK